MALICYDGLYESLCHETFWRSSPRCHSGSRPGGLRVGSMDLGSERAWSLEDMRREAISQVQAKMSYLGFYRLLLRGCALNGITAHLQLDLGERNPPDQISDPGSIMEWLSRQC